MKCSMSVFVIPYIDEIVEMHTVSHIGLLSNETWCKFSCKTHMQYKPYAFHIAYAEFIFVGNHRDRSRV